ncbi:lipase chaperone [Vibrio sp. V09_P4A23P171]|uniref:lipase secretion chaperone n=1 Tax=Vibrio sp. V09_P4A23P171 TaxID=1938664 RepID=UPI000B8E4F1B|nr:lipase secretion chaperone [Vibrio sp. V09_P4A23P171]OXX39519.1 lipase chaperone [Vibrio sp. V09_P4A23P171]
MKKPALFGFVVIILGSIGAVLFLQKPVSSQSALQTPSQQDTQIDSASSLDLIHYFISTLGESSLPEVKQRIAQHADQDEGVVIDPMLFEQFIQYKQALAELEANASIANLDLATLAEINQQLLKIQSQFFNVDQQSMLFGEENALRNLALEKLRIKSQAVDSYDEQQQWQTLLAQQPEYIQRSERNVQLLPALNASRHLSTQEQYLVWNELVGEQGAQRLTQLSEQREQFSQHLENYLQQRSAVLENTRLSQDEKNQQITQLRTQTFEVKQLKRVEALERLRDQSL